MVFVKILGGIDLIAAFTLLMLIFGVNPLLQFMLFSAGLLFIKSFFILTGDVLSWIDLFSSIVILLSIFFNLSSILLWLPAFLLLAKGFVSFL